MREHGPKRASRWLILLMVLITLAAGVPLLVLSGTTPSFLSRTSRAAMTAGYLSSAAQQQLAISSVARDVELRPIELEGITAALGALGGATLFCRPNLSRWWQIQRVFKGSLKGL